MKSFDTLKGILKQDKVKRMKLVAKIIFNVYMFLITYFIFLQKAYLIGVGGSHNRVVGNVLTKLMKFSTAALFCLKGQNLTKRRFDKTEIMDLVLGRFFLF